MASRYDKHRLIVNNNDLYQDVLDKKNIKHIIHYNTRPLSFPTMKERQSLQRTTHIWQWGDRYYKLAHKYYNSSNLWWIIAWYNEKPTEAHVSIGDIIYIPLPLEKVMEFLKV